VYLRLCLWVCILLPNFHVQTLTSKVAFGDRTYMEEIKVKWGHESDTWSTMTDILIRRERHQKDPFLSLSAHVHWKGQVRTHSEGGIPGIEASTDNCFTPFSWISSLNCEEINFGCVSHQVYDTLLQILFVVKEQHSILFLKEGNCIHQLLITIPK
jgi:hypothetical protein